MSDTDEQWVVEQVAQMAKRMADRRLGPAEAARSASYGTFRQERIQRYQKVQIYPG